MTVTRTVAWPSTPRRRGRRRPDPRDPRHRDAASRPAARTTRSSGRSCRTSASSIAMDEAGLKVVETAVGDRYVLEAMKEGGFTLGGEQSGHVILAEHATTGDGTLTALHLLARVAASGRSLAQLAGVMTRYPQVLINVRGVDGPGSPTRRGTRCGRVRRGAPRCHRSGSAASVRDRAPGSRDGGGTVARRGPGGRRPTRECREQRAGSLGRRVGGCRTGCGRRGARGRTRRAPTR